MTKFHLILSAVVLIAACQKSGAPAPGAPAGSGVGEARTLPSITQSKVDLLTARKGFQTKLNPTPASTKEGAAPKPPTGVYDLVHYPSPAGSLAAYLTPDPKDGKKHPAMVWAHGGFGGIGNPAWEKAPPQNDQSASAFREAGIVEMLPSWRGENDNPGRFELFYGEVDDLLAAIDYVSKLPYVDPQRIYIGGHSTGATLVLLASTATDKFRAAFAFGGAPDVGRLVANGKGYGNTPFDYHNAEEGRLRSAIYFTSFIKRPTFYFEGANAPTYLGDAGRMRQEALGLKVPFFAFGIPNHDHFSLLAPMTRMIAQKIVADTVATQPFEITPADLGRALAAK